MRSVLVILLLAMQLFSFGQIAEKTLDSIIRQTQRILPQNWLIAKTKNGFEVYKISLNKKNEFFEKFYDLFTDSSKYEYDLLKYPYDKESIVRELIQKAYADSTFYSSGLSVNPDGGYKKKKGKLVYVPPKNNGIVYLTVEFGGLYSELKARKTQQWNDSLKVIYTNCFKENPNGRDAYYHLIDQFNDYRYWIPDNKFVKSNCQPNIADFIRLPYQSREFSNLVYIIDQRKNLKNYVLQGSDESIKKLVKFYLFELLGIINY